MPRLEWIGKEKVINHAREVPFHVLERKYGYGNSEGSSQNKIIHGDNLLALKSLYTAEEDRMNDFEHRAVMGLASLPNIRWWHRNIERKGFCINGFLNHYPDFLVMTDSGVLLAVETKGDDRDNSDSRQKLELGKAWEKAAGDRYGYFMVFDKKPMEGAYSFEDFIDMVRGV